jgi:hypothetical protein
MICKWLVQNDFNIFSKFVCCGCYTENNVAFTLISFAVHTRMFINLFVTFLRNGKENKEVGAICFEIRIPMKKKKELLRKVPANKNIFWFVNISKYVSSPRNGAIVTFLFQHYFYAFSSRNCISSVFFNLSYLMQNIVVYSLYSDLIIRFVRVWSQDLSKCHVNSVLAFTRIRINKQWIQNLLILYVNSYTVRAIIIPAVCIFFTPFFPSVYIVGRFIIQS